jgi:DNA-binding transcriptional ArsR family regulator
LGAASQSGVKEEVMETTKKNNVKKFRKTAIKKKRIKVVDEEFEVRDIRESFYVIDNLFIRTYARACGVYAVSVYNILCSYANIDDQYCYPSIPLIADKLGISGRQVTRALKKLEEYGIIKVKRVLGGRSNYWLLGKDTWKNRKGLEYYAVGRIRKATRGERAGVVVGEV